MNITQWAIFFIITLLLLKRVAITAAFILFIAYFFYDRYIIDLDGVYYYSCSALLNLLTGMVLQLINKPAAICSYMLVHLNVLGFFLWYNYYPPDIYDNIAIVILVAQLILILPKGLINGLGYNSKHIMAKSGGFDGTKTRITVHKDKKTKEG